MDLEKQYILKLLLDHIIFIDYLFYLCFALHLYEIELNTLINKNNKTFIAQTINDIRIGMKYKIEEIIVIL